MFEVPRSTLKNKVRSKETDIKETDQYPTWSETSVALQSRRRTCQLLSDDGAKFFELITRSIKRLAFELALKNCLAHPLSIIQGRADWKWLCNFMCRHPRLGWRKPQVTSAKFFDIRVFEPVLRLINFSSHRLFNYEETGLCVVQHKVRKVISLKVSEGSLHQQRGFSRDSFYLQECYRYVCSFSSGVS